MSAEFWMACAHCAKALAFTRNSDVIKARVFCNKDCLEAFAVTNKLTEEPPTPGPPQIDWSQYAQLQKYATASGLSGLEKLLGTPGY